MAPGDDTDSGMESQEGSLMESQGSLTTGSGKSAKSTSEKEGLEPASTDEIVVEPSGASSSSAGLVGNEGTGTTVEEFTPETKPEVDDPFGDEPDESVAERLWGLTEMFPESVRNVTYTAVTTTKSSVKTFYGFSRSAFWVIFTSSIILFAPVIFEVERVQMEEAQRTQQKQMLLGPNTAVSAGGMPLMPPLHR